MDELMLDGNAVAGLLQEVFAVEITTAVGTCASCGAAGSMSGSSAKLSSVTSWRGARTRNRALTRNREPFDGGCGNHAERNRMRMSSAPPTALACH